MSTAATLHARLESLLGAGRMVTSEGELQNFAIASRAPFAVAAPQTAEEVSGLVRFAASEKLAVVCCGSRSKLEFGMPANRYDLAVDLSALREIVHYDPEDLTLSVGAGLPLRELARALGARKQFLPLAVPFAETATIGGTVVSGIDSTLRLQYGTARDFLIGAEFVDGTGRLCKSGGRVVKNVTGYDLHKLLIGSQGTLAAITRLNFRTFPLPESRGGFVAGFASLEAAFQFRSCVLQAGLPLSNLELFDPEFAGLLATRAVETLPANAWIVYTMFEGSELVLRRIERDLHRHATDACATQSEILAETTSAQWGGELREAIAWLTQAAAGAVLIRIAGLSLTPSAAGQLLETSARRPIRRALLVRPCNVSWLVLFPDKEEEAQQSALASCVSKCVSFVQAKQGSANLLHVPTSLKQDVNAWGSPPPDFPLMQRLKRAFDPQGIFAPGRFVGGI